MNSVAPKEFIHNLFTTTYAHGPVHLFGDIWSIASAVFLYIKQVQSFYESAATLRTENNSYVTLGTEQMYTNVAFFFLHVDC